MVDTAAPYFDAGDATSCQSAEAGPYGDSCLGVPEITTPFEDATVVGITFAVQVEAPCCIRDMQVYVAGDKVVSLIAGYTFDGSVTVSKPGSYMLNVNGWNKTDASHDSPHVGFKVVVDD